MAKKQRHAEDERKPQKKLTLNKETIRDLTPKGDKNIRGGALTNSKEGVMRCQ